MLRIVSCNSLRSQYSRRLAQLFVLIEFDVCILLCGSLDAFISFLKHVRWKPLSIIFECCDHLFAESQLNAFDPLVQLA